MLRTEKQSPWPWRRPANFLAPLGLLGSLIVLREASDFLVGLLFWLQLSWIFKLSLSEKLVQIKDEPSALHGWLELRGPGEVVRRDPCWWDPALVLWLLLCNLRHIPHHKHPSLSSASPLWVFCPLASSPELLPTAFKSTWPCLRNVLEAPRSLTVNTEALAPEGQDFSWPLGHPSPAAAPCYSSCPPTAWTSSSPQSPRPMPLLPSRPGPHLSTLYPEAVPSHHCASHTGKDPIPWLLTKSATYIHHLSLIANDLFSLLFKILNKTGPAYPCWLLSMNYMSYCLNTFYYWFVNSSGSGTGIGPNVHVDWVERNYSLKDGVRLSRSCLINRVLFGRVGLGATPPAEATQDTWTWKKISPSVSSEISWDISHDRYFMLDFTGFRKEGKDGMPHAPPPLQVQGPRQLNNRRDGPASEPHLGGRGGCFRLAVRPEHPGFSGKN